MCVYLRIFPVHQEDESTKHSPPPASEATTNPAPAPAMTDDPPQVKGLGFRVRGSVLAPDFRLKGSGCCVGV